MNTKISIEKQRDFLGWLASWSSLEIDKEWFGEAESESPSRSARHLIKHAAYYYRDRGTPRGLKRHLWAFYGLDVEVVERSWPMGMVIGHSSTIGIDTFVLEPPRTDHGFILLVHPPAGRSSSYSWILDLLGDDASLFRVVESHLGGEGHGRVILSYFLPRTAEIPAAEEQSGGIEDLRRLVAKVQHVVDGEKPAHLRYYVGIVPTEAAPQPSELPVMTIGVDSTLGFCYLN